MYNFIIVLLLLFGTASAFFLQYLCNFGIGHNILIMVFYIAYVGLMIDGYIIGKVSDKRFKKYIN